MGWDDDSHDSFDWDYIDYMNKTGIYEDTGSDDSDPNDELYDYGLDPDELEYMSEGKRRQILEENGLDPDDYDFVSTGNGRKSQSGTGASSRNSSVSNRNNTTPRSNDNTNLDNFFIMVGVIFFIAIAVGIIKLFGIEIGIWLVIFIFIIIYKMNG